VKAHQGLPLVRPSDVEELVEIAESRHVTVDYGTMRVLADHLRARLQRRGRRQECGFCGVEGHNRRACPTRLGAVA
jgi:hypothetical protein